MRMYEPQETERPLDGPAAGEEPSDRSLLRRIQAGRSDAATELYLRYAERLRALVHKQRGADLATRVDSDDLVQSIFRTFFRRASQGHYDVPEGEELWKLFLVIALYKIRDTGAYHRAAKRDVKATEAGVAFERAVQRHAGPDEIALLDLRLVIEEILEVLPASQRAIVELRIEGYTVEEISKKTGRSKRSVERGLQEFRRQLSALLEEDS